ncbi:protein furry isoform X2 [Rhopalosiphum maidis]|uniref:protein furry isoform X2 n=1 Tax=Rhopalosiphum maidis TaxID=43146 RepID=UPI000EFED607|nr:protein furry isoform X2 [Rhopalosiphum maidis]
MEEQNMDINIDTNNREQIIRDQTVMLGNVEFQSEIDSGTSTPKLDPFQNTQSNSNTIIDSSLTITPESQRQSVITVLPWGAHKERSPFPNVDTDIKPGEYVMRTLFADFTVQAERKMEEVMTEPEKPLMKILQRGEDAQFDQLLIAFGSVAEHCLPSILKALFAWYDRQIGILDINATDSKKIELKGKNDIIDTKEVEVMGERKDLAVEFIFCLALIEVLKQLPFHPGHEDLVTYIENLCFKHFKYREGAQNCPNAPNIHMVADLYAEVLGVLAQSRFLSVRKRFMAELKELRAKEPSPHVIQAIISLLMGMKFFRIKMVPIEDFEASFQFMQECAQYFLEVKDKDIKHSMAGLFVEILLPMAGIVKNEVNVPCLKNFVESLYSTTLDMCTKSKHRLSLFPLVTCLLCVSQKIFFLQNWHYFLAMCLSNLKNRDTNMSRVALEALYRLLWVYMVRIKCESNSATQSRLQSIVHSLFPKGSKAVVPRDTPLNIFVKIIQFIAQERLDFAMREIVYDLLSVGRPIKLILTPERMSIGLRAFLVVADSLEQKEGEPPMPGTSGVLPSGSTLRVKKTFLNKMLTEDTARNIGIHSYFPNVRRVFVEILRALDTHYGRPLMMTSTQNMNKEPDEMITGERKPRIDLFRTCVAAVPRLIPETMTGAELVDMLSRLTVHMDEELRALAYQSLQTLIIDFPEWRHEVITSFTQFLARDVQDTFPQLIDNGLRMLLQLLTCWKNSITPGLIKNQTEKNKKIDLSNNQQKFKKVDFSQAEALALVMLCNCRPSPRRLSAHILREIKSLVKILDNIKDILPVIDVIDKACPQLIERCLPMLPSAEKLAAMTASAANSIDLQWIVDRNAPIWTADDINSTKTASSLSLLGGTGNSDPWGTILFGILSPNVLINQCPSVIAQAWLLVFSRVHNLFTVIDPTPVSDNRASLLRSSAPPRKPLTERDQYLTLWRYYTMFAMRVVPLAPNPVVRCASPDLSLSSSPDSLTIGERNDSKSVTPTALYKLIVPLLRCEVADVRDAAIYAMGTINPEALKDLMEELISFIKEAVDRKQENMRRRRRRDALRLQLVKVFELIAGYGTFGCSSFVLDRDTYSLHPTIEEYVDGARICLELESEKDSLREIKLYFCRFVMKMIKSFELETYRTLLKRELRQNLFTLFCNWSEHWASSAISTSLLNIDLIKDDLQMASLQAACAVLTCGPCFNHTLAEPDGSLYTWIDVLLAHPDKRVHQLALETVVLLLDCNPDMGALLDWVVDRCYTAVPSVADACFHALGVIFSTREYPCDHYTAIINVTLMNTGCPRSSVRDTALQLLQVLDKRFFGSGCVELLPPILPSESPVTARDGREKHESFDNEKNTEIVDVLLCSTFCQSQFNLSQQLAQIHPELTMPMFSEITCRFQTARPEVRQLLLHYLVPWLHNMELVDPNVPPPNPLSYFQYYPAEEGQENSCRREGWGSVEATEMVLNNLFYITAKFADEHPKDIEDVWSTLCICWPNNLKVIIRYLVIISGMAPHELLPFAKRVTLYLARSRPDRLLDEMMTELQTVETLNCLIERMETPPFYRLTSMRKTSGMGTCSNNTATTANGGLGSGSGGSGGVGNVVDMASTNVNENETEHTTSYASAGMIHTKRHSGDDPSKIGSCKSDSTVKSISRFPSNRMSSKWQRIIGDQSTLQDEMQSPVEDSEMNYDRLSPNYGDFPQPHPLPMPEYGGYFAPLKEYLPTNIPSSSGFHRCNIAVMLLKDLPSDSLDIDWSIHMPLMLHIALLGMDHSRSLVHQHCKQLLLNLLLVLANNSDQLTIAQVLLNRDTIHLSLGLPTPPVPVTQHNFTEANESFDSYLQTPIGTSYSQSTSLVVLPSPCEDDASTVILGMDQLNPPTPNVTIKEIVKSLIDFISSRGEQPLWHYEDITAKVWSIRSGEQLDVFLQHILRVFHEFLPHALISERWAQTAIQLGLSCSSRHYAGRSLQIFRALRIPITSRMLSEILSRLIETVAEQGEDMQGYVTELLLTLEAAVDSLETDFRPLDMTRDIFKSTPNLNNKDANSMVEGGGGGVAGGAASGSKLPRSVAQKAPINRRVPPTCFNQSSHFRSTSYSVSHYSRRAVPYSQSSTAAAGSDVTVKDDGRSGSGGVGNGGNSGGGCKSNNCAATQQNLKLLGDSATQDDKLTVLGQLFWLAVSLLESDYEHEFLLACRLLSRVLRRLPLDRPDTRDKVDKLAVQLRTPSFPGVHALLLKGCTNPVTYEHVVPLLSQLTPLLDLLVVDPSESLAFPMNVVALLPYMLLHYEDANELCIMSAENIAQLCTNKSMKLENLATVMTLYSRRTFSKESFQWTKCVVKYLYDAYSHLSHNMLAFLVEVLERGPYIIQLPVLNIIHCMLHYVDLSSTSSQPFNADLLRVIAKYIEGVNYKEALKILKLVVTRSSTLVAPPTSTHYIYWDSHATASHYSFSDIDVFMKKELPGRTMDFTFDMSQTPLIGRKVAGSTALDLESANSNSLLLQQRRSTSLSPSDSAVPGWKRPWLCQSRVRELLVSLLMSCGQRVGLPKSPSVIFSQSSELLERHSSRASSTEEVSAPDVSIPSDSRKEREDNADHFGTVFKDFDFLEYESESVEGESTDNFNWGVRRLPLGGNDLMTTNAPGGVAATYVTGADGICQVEESVSEQTPMLNAKKGNDESSDDELGSVSPLDEIAACNAQLEPDNASCDGHRDRTDSITRSDTSGSSIGDLGDLTPCNASPNLNALMSFQRDDTEECWRSTIKSLLDQKPSNALHMFHILHRVVKDIIRKCVLLTREACVTLNEYVEEDPATTGCCAQSHVNCRQMLTHLNSAIIVLTTHADPPLVWFSPTALKMDGALRFPMLQIREHIDTLLDRKDQTSECLFSVRATLKVCKLGERMPEGSSTSSGGGGGAGGGGESGAGGSCYSNEESILDLGKALYKLHLQLLLLLEAAAKMYIALSVSATDNKLQNLSAEVSTVRRALLRAKEESGTHPLAPTPEESLVQILQESDWPNALTYAKQNKSRWLDELISTGTDDDDDDITSILSVYCHLLIEKHSDGFIVTEEDLMSVTNGLMTELFPMLEALNCIESRVKGLPKTSNYPQN